MKRKLNAKKIGVIIFVIVAMITVISIIYPKTNIQKINAAVTQTDAANTNQYIVKVLGSNFVYNGKSWQPEIKVYKNNQLVPRASYIIYYYNNLNAGKANIYVYGVKNDWSVSTTFTIQKSTITVYPKETIRQYGQKNPEIQYTHSGCIKGVPKFLGSLRTKANMYSNIGVYDVTIGDLRLVDNGEFKARNYNLILGNEKNKFKVEQADINNIVSTNVYVSHYEWTYCGEAFYPTVTVKNLTVNTDYCVIYNYTSNFTDMGEHLIFIYGLGNYTGMRTVRVKINQKELIVTPKSQSKYQGQANPSLTYTYSGNVSGEIPAFTGFLRTNADTNSKVGNYRIYQYNLQLKDNGKFKARNYNLQIKEGVLRVVSANTVVNNTSKNILNLQYSINEDFPNRCIIVECGGVFYKRPTELIIKDGSYILVKGKDYIITNESLVYNLVSWVGNKKNYVYQATYTIRGIGKYKGENVYKVDTQKL